MKNFADSLQNNSMDNHLRSKIFNTTETDLFFINTAYFYAYLQLFEGIRDHSGLLVLTSEAGVGKTLLLHKLENESSEKIKLAICHSTNLDFNDLIEITNDQLGIFNDEIELSEKIKALKEYLKQCATQKTDVALLIDDAHHLSEQVLSSLLTLSYSEFEKGHLLQIVLSGTPVLEEILYRIPIFHAYLPSSVHIRLEPLAPVDVAAFISLQAQRTDDPAVDSLSSPQVVERIVDYTGGIPRLIESLCKRALLIAQINGQTTVSIAIIDEAASELMLKDEKSTPPPDAPPVLLETTQSDTVVQIMTRTPPPAQEQTPLIEKEIYLSETRSLAVKPVEEHSSTRRRWNDLQTTEDRRYPSRSTRPQVALLVFLALFAGLLGGAASIYLHPFLSAPTPMATRMEPPTPAPPQPPTKIEPAPIEVAPSVVDNAEIKPPLESSPQSILSERLSIADYMRNGHLLLTRGDIVSARLFYEEAANSGSAAAMTAVGKTYDPVVLGQLGIKGFQADPVKAAEWYLKAGKAGDPEHTERLDGLRRWLSNAPSLGEIEATTLQQLLR